MKKVILTLGLFLAFANTTMNANGLSTTKDVVLMQSKEFLAPTCKTTSKTVTTTQEMPDGSVVTTTTTVTIRRPCGNPRCGQMQ